MYSYLWMWRMSTIAAKWAFLVVVLRASFMISFHSLSTAAFASGINIAWSERSFAHYLVFLRLPSLRDRSPESSEPYVTLASRDSLSRTASGICTPFFPSSHLRASRPRWVSKVSRRIFVPQIRCVARRDNMCLLLTFKENQVKSFRRIFSSERIGAQSCNTIQNSVLLLQYQYMFWLFQISSRRQAICDLDVMSFEFCQSLPGPHVSSQRSCSIM